MSLSWKIKKEDPKTLILLWKGNIWREVPKYLFINDLRKISTEIAWNDFLNQFHLLEESAAKKLALFLLSKKNYLISDLEAKLRARGFSPLAIQAAIEFCLNKGFLNDQQEVLRLIAKEERKGLGAKAILFKLRQKKKINDSLLRQSLDQSAISERETLERWLSKHAKKIQRDDPIAMRKLIAKLARRGFSIELIFELLRNCTKI